ncbi:MAG TPA: type II secretion system F family protein [Acidimicrobiales bacterium]|nr:type II secretion system F family protein [Acidimicrobiales bacterium]
MLPAAVVFIFVTITLMAYAAVLKADERISVRAARARLADYESPADKRHTDLQVPFATRVFDPTAVFIANLARAALPQSYVDKVQHKLVLAGRGQIEEADRFLVLHVLSVVFIPILWYVTWQYTSLSGLELEAVFGLIALAGVIGPDAWLNRVVEDRQLAIRKKLPDVLDLLTISVEAGLGFEQALARAVTMVPGPLSEEFARMLGEMRAGSSRSDALGGLDTRTGVPEVRSFVLALKQADTFGVSIGSILRSQSAEMRVKRHQLAQEEAQKAPVKMLFPMVFCIMPALFVITAGPAFLNIFHAFSGR